MPYKYIRLFILFSLLILVYACQSNKTPNTEATLDSTNVSQTGTPNPDTLLYENFENLGDSIANTHIFKFKTGNWQLSNANYVINNSYPSQHPNHVIRLNANGTLLMDFNQKVTDTVMINLTMRRKVTQKRLKWMFMSSTDNGHHYDTIALADTNTFAVKVFYPIQNYNAIRLKVVNLSESHLDIDDVVIHKKPQY